MKTRSEPTDKLRRFCTATADRSSLTARPRGNKQGSFPPRNRTPDAKRSVFALLVGEQWCHSRDIGHGFWWKRLACREVLFITRRTGMVGRNEACGSEAIVHLFKVGGARQYVVVRVEWVETETMAHAELNPGARHKLHQAHRAAR